MPVRAHQSLRDRSGGGDPGAMATQETRGAEGPGNKVIATTLLEALAVRGRSVAAERAARALEAQGTELAAAPTWLADDAIPPSLRTGPRDPGEGLSPRPVAASAGGRRRALGRGIDRGTNRLAHLSRERGGGAHGGGGVCPAARDARSDPRALWTPSGWRGRRGVPRARGRVLSLRRALAGE